MEYFNPVDLYFGSSVRNKIAQECFDKSILVVCSASALARYENDNELESLFSSKDLFFEHGFDSNPSLTDILEISDKYRNENFDLVLGLGGGSAMDVAKISSVSIPALQKGLLLDDLLENPDNFHKFEAIDCIQIPTTAGTGSEVTPFATVWDYERNKKKSLSHPNMYAKKAFIDPDFLSDLLLFLLTSPSGSMTAFLLLLLCAMSSMGLSPAVLTKDLPLGLARPGNGILSPCPWTILLWGNQSFLLLLFHPC